MAEKNSSKEPNAKSKKRRWKVSDTIVVAVIGAIATIVVALIPVLSSERTTTVFPTETSTSIPESKPTLTSTPLPIEITDTNGLQMELVPGGEFTMGTDNNGPLERPAHPVNLDTYYIDKFEVTNFYYKQCVDIGICQKPKQFTSETRSNYYDNLAFAKYPVIHVDWNMARVYCEWRNARLPTEAEWEKAARGTDGRIYPWGNRIDETFANYNKNIGDTTVVGSYESGKSPYGLYDMAGNVWEWVNDYWSSDYFSSSPYQNPLGPTTGDGESRRVLKGGSWVWGSETVYAANRIGYPPGYDFADFGFRCARSVNP